MTSRSPRSTASTPTSATRAGRSGVFRALRTIPVMVDICHDMERYCPDAILLNYTNPMAMLCRAMQRETKHQGDRPLPQRAGHGCPCSPSGSAPPTRRSPTSARGSTTRPGTSSTSGTARTPIPLLREAVKRPEIYKEEIVRNEMFMHLGYYVTESSGHNSEYNWWFRKRPDLIEKYCTHGTGWNPGVYAYILNEYLAREDELERRDIQEWLDNPAPLDLERGHEYAAYIINAYKGGEPFKFNGNVPNTSLITNLPEDACVEVPVYADKRGFNAHPRRGAAARSARRSTTSAWPSRRWRSRPASPATRRWSTMPSPTTR